MKTPYRLALAAVLASTYPLLAGDLFPLQTGNQWTYREAKTGMNFTVRVSTPALVNGQIYYSLQGYVGRTLLVRQNEFGNLVYLDTDSSQEYPLTIFEAVERAWWEAPFRVCEQEGQTSSQPVVHDGPSGPLAKVVEVKYRSLTCRDAGVESEQYAENIGMVRRVESSIAGPRRYDLVYARVGKQVIETQAHGRFTVTAVPATEPEFLDVTLRLQAASDEPIKLVFPTGQEFEVAIQDTEGRTLWTWSAGRFFPQAFMTRTVQGEWSVTVRAPRPAPPTGTEPAVYFAQAWLTTATPVPRFSASASFSVSPVSRVLPAAAAR